LLTKLREQTSDNPSQQASLAELTPLVSRRLAMIEDSIEFYRQNQRSIIIQTYPYLQEGKQTMDAIRQIVAQMNDREEILLKDQLQTADYEVLLVTIISYLGVALNLGFLVFLYLVIRREMWQRRQSENVLQSQNYDLARAREAADASVIAKNQFLANMSHEIRTPMNAVIGMTDLLLETKLDSMQRDFAETIRNSGDILLTVINDILDFSKIQSGKLEIESLPFELRDAIEDCLACKANEKGLELTYSIEPTVPKKILGDVTRLHQILVNLLNNAIKFTAVGEVVVIISCNDAPVITEEGQIHQIQFAVTDTGIGIPSDRLDRLFQSFSQVDASNTREYGGTGLGLAICQQLSEIMGGRIWVQSQPGAGSTFYFTISAPALDYQEQELIPQPQFIGKTILIVDDFLTNCRILSLQTESWGFIPFATQSSMAALHLIEQGEKFDLAILDMQMPEMDGIELAAKIRQSKHGEKLPLILLSSVSNVDFNAIIKFNFFAQLTKPVRQSKLFNIILRLYSESEAVDTQESPIVESSGVPNKSSLTILLVEDNATNQKVASFILKKLGYTADIANNGKEAINAIAAFPYDLVFMDIQMPIMDGLAATRRVCEIYPNKSDRPWIVAMTANALPDDRRECLEAGMDDYISKPISKEQISLIISRCQVRQLPTLTKGNLRL
jgi:signal transduction histidine kinase/DNA-binding response OmpR family regulator